MKKKGMLAIILATTMIVGSSMAVMAEDNIDTENTVSGSGSVSGDSETSVVNKKVYSVGVPTSKTFTLYVDPQGLYGLEEGQTLTDEQAAERAGKIFCLSKMPVHNMSSIDLKVDLSVELKGDADAEANKADINTGNNNKVLLYAAPTKNPITKVVSGDTNLSEYATPDNGIVVTKGTAVNLDFVLPKAGDYKSHKISGNNVYRKDDPAAGNGTAIAFGGWVNTEADWSAFDKDASTPKSVKVDVVYTYAAADGTEPDAMAGNAFMVSANGATTVEIPAGTDTPGETRPSVTFVRGTTTTDPTFNIPLPSGASSATAPTISIVGTGSNTTPKTPGSGTIWTYNATTGRLVFLRASSALVSGWTPDTYTCTLTFSNSATAIVTLIIQ